MVSIKEYIKKYWKLIIILIIYICCFFILYKLFTRNSFIIGNDSLTQYKIFYEEWLKIVDNFIHNHTLNTYSYNMFLGTDFYSAMGYYCTGDIFLPILYLFRNNLYVGLIIETVLCVLISGITMSIFLDYAGIKNKKIVIYISILYAVAGHSINYVQVYMFHRFYSFLPLLFYGTQKYFNEKRKTVFIMSIAILFMQNFYFMYPTLIVLFIYCLVECFKRRFNIKTIIKEFFIFVFLIIIGFFISSFITLPSIIYTYKNVVSRSLFNASPFWNIKTFIGLLFSYIMPNPTGVISSIFSTNNYYEDSQNMFMTIIPFIFLVYFLIKKDNRNTYNKILFYILTLIIIIKPLNSILHGFAEPSLRWMFLYSFYSFYLAALGLEEYSSIDIKLIKTIGLGVIIFFTLNFIVLFFVINNNPSYENLKGHLIYIFVGLFISICLYYFIFKKFQYSIILSVVVTLFFNLFFTIKTSVISGSSAIIDGSEIDYNLNYDTKYFRFYLSNLDSYYGIPHDCNNSLTYNIMTTSTYSSTIETVIRPFLDTNDCKLFLDWGIEISDHNLLTMLGTKYLILGDKYKEKNGIPAYEKVYNLKSLSNFDVYINPDYKGFGYSANKVKYFKNYSGNTKDFIDYILVDDENVDILKYKINTCKPLNVIYMGENIILADIVLDEDNILLIPIPNNSGWEITVNDESIESISVNGGFVGLELKKGYNAIKMSFHTPYLKEGFVLSLFGLLLLAYIFKKEKK